MTHFIYMMSQDKKEGYNFFALTSGNKPLEKAISDA
jgi:hypothetical protein